MISSALFRRSLLYAWNSSNETVILHTFRNLQEKTWSRSRFFHSSQNKCPWHIEQKHSGILVKQIHEGLTKSFPFTCNGYLGSRCFGNGASRRYFSSQTFRNLKKSNENENQSKKSNNGEKNGIKNNNQNGSEKGETLVQRFKRVYKEHGLILVAVHVVTSACWFGAFYGIIQWGVDIVAVLESIGFSEKYIKPFKSSKAGDFAVMYLMYKLATPARYTVTLTGTALSIRVLRHFNFIKKPKGQDTMQNMAQQGMNQGKTKIKGMTSNARNKIRTNIKSGKDKYQSRMTRLRHSSAKRRLQISKGAKEMTSRLKFFRRNKKNGNGNGKDNKNKD